MTTNIQLGHTYSNGRIMVKPVEKNVGMAGYNCLTWVKSKQNWTKKTSYYDIQNENWYEFYNSAIEK